MEFIIGGIVIMAIIAFAVMKLRKEKKWVIDSDAPIKVGSIVVYQGRKYDVLDIPVPDTVVLRDRQIMTLLITVPIAEVAAYVLK